MKVPSPVVFLLGLISGLALFAFIEGFTGGGLDAQADPRQSGLSWAWLAFGYFAQLLFTGRMLVQWLATEKKKQSVVPVHFWWLSLFGGAMLLVYFLRRGDPVGVIGQLFGVIVYARNLMLIFRRPAPEEAGAGGSGQASTRENA